MLRGIQRAGISTDLIAGATLLAIAVPEQVATARLANMPAAAGLYALIAGSVVFALVGKDRHMSVGADSTIAPVMAVAVAGVAATGTVRYTDLVSFLALMVGVLLIAVGLFKLGWIAEFLSQPVVTGVLAGIGVEIVVRQLPAVLGLAGGGVSTIDRLRHVWDELGSTNGWAVAITVVVLVLILGGEKIDRRLPGALIGVALAIAAVGAFGLKSHGVLVVGAVHGGLPSFALPTSTLAEARRLVPAALTVAFLCLAQTAATARAGSGGAPAADDFSRDLMAIGAGSLLAGVSGAFAVDTSPARTEVLRTAGAQSQLAGLFAAGCTLVLVLFGTGLLKDLPTAALGAILVFVASRLFRAATLVKILRFDRVEFVLAAVTLLAVAFVGIEQGFVVAVLLSLADRIRRTVRPQGSVLGREPGTDHWVPQDIGRATEQVPGILVYLLYAPLWYGNADNVRLLIHRAVTDAGTGVRALVLNADGMSDIDFTGALALAELAKELNAAGVITAIARSSRLVHHDLKHSGLLDEIGADHLYASVEEAVGALAH